MVNSSSDDDRVEGHTSVRIPVGLKRRLEQAQIANRRKSLSAEIVARLAASFGLNPSPFEPGGLVASETAIEALALATKNAERLDRVEAELNLNVPDFTKDA